VPIEQRRESIAIAMLEEKCEQLLVAQSAAIASDDDTTDTVKKPIRHILGPPLQRGDDEEISLNFFKIFSKRQQKSAAKRSKKPRSDSGASTENRF
jgi:hypothetical protein